tara:strand:- start:669 stop:941 length:273 start_codon:yes stop_codon:yes gene_type:complete
LKRYLNSPVRQYSHDFFHKDQNEKKIAPIYRICLTGGPCSGKTTAIAQLEDLVEDKGVRVFTVPEAATLLMKSGAMIDNYKLTDSQRQNL